MVGAVNIPIFETGSVILTVGYSLKLYDFLQKKEFHKNAAFGAAMFSSIAIFYIVRWILINLGWILINLVRLTNGY